MIDLPVHQKLKRLKAPIKDWNKNCFGNVDENIKKLETESNKLDCIYDNMLLDQEEISRDKAIRGELHKWKTMNYQTMRQYSR